MTKLPLKTGSAVCALLLAATTWAATDSKPTPDPPTKTHSQAAPSSSAKSGTSVSGHSTAKSKKSRKSVAKRHPRGQLKIESQRALEIQEALIREHYLTGKPTGVWNDATQQAMQRYQADNNWQSKTTPDARALIKLGLGPDHQHLLNPESAMTSQPQQAREVSTPDSTTDPNKPQK